MIILTMVTAALAMFASIIPVQASAEPLPLVYFQIRAQHIDKCLTVASAAIVDGAIAARLVLSIRTVGNHLNHVYGKLGITRDDLPALFGLEPLSRK